MVKRAARPSARVFRPARSPVPAVGAKLGDIACTVTNLSSSGAMLRSRLEVPVGREITLVFDLPSPVITQVRVVRCEPVDVPLPAAVWRQHDFALGVHFLKHHDELAATIRSLAKQTGIEHSQARVLVLGTDDEMSRLVDASLSGAEYAPRVLTHPRYAVSIAKRIGAKAIIVNLEIDPQLSSPNVIDTLRGDPVTATIPIILCARQAPPQRYLDDRRLRLLLVPFAPGDIVSAVDRAIDELS